MTELTKPTEAQCRRFTLAIGEWHEKEFLPYVVNPTTYDSASILAKMKEKLGEKKYKEFINSFTSYTDCRGWTTYMSTIDFINNYIFSPAALIDKASEYCEKEGK